MCDRKSTVCNEEPLGQENNVSDAQALPRDLSQKGHIHLFLMTRK